LGVNGAFFIKISNIQNGANELAPKGNRNAWKHGHYTAEAKAMRQVIRQLLSDARDTIEHGAVRQTFALYDRRASLRSGALSRSLRTSSSHKAKPVTE
jgi:hypothetical protein